MARKSFGQNAGKGNAKDRQHANTAKGKGCLYRAKSALDQIGNSLQRDGKNSDGRGAENGEKSPKFGSLYRLAQ